MGHRQRFLGAGLVAALVFCQGGAPAAAQPQLYGGTTDVVAVEVPVQVVRNGQPVRGLTADDFEVYQGRKKQRITGFEVLDLAAPLPAGAAAAVPAAARRHFLLLFDLSFSESRAVLQARKAAATVLDQLHRSDLVGVATYSASRGPQLVLGFTSDRAQVAAALETLGAPELVNRSGDPLKLFLADFDAELRQASSQGQVNRETNLEIMRRYLEQLSLSSQRADLETRRNEVSAFTRSLTDLARLMNSVTGRKYVVYLSEGFDSSILTGSSDAEDAERVHEEMAGGGFNKKIQSDKRFGDTRAINDFEEMLEGFRRADCVVQSVDIGGLRAGSDLGFQRQGGTDTLLAMARDTGGDLYQSFNDLGEAMRQMLARTGVTYVLSFQPEEIRLDGSYHELRVELKGQPRGTRLVHRPGYYAPKPYSQLSSVERLLQAAGQVVSGEDQGLLPVAVLAAPLPALQGRAYVPVVVEVDGPALLSGIPPGTSLPAEVYVYALDGAGTVHDFVAQTVGLELAKLETALLHGGFRFVGHLDLPPGEYSVRVLVRNGVTGVTGLRVLPVTVPAPAQGRPLLLPPLFPQPPGSWPTVREAAQSGEVQVAYPFRTQEEPYVPTPRPLLAPGREARVALIGYHLGGGDLQATARITAADGREVGTAEVRLLERESGDPERLAAAFVPPDLPPGEYRLVVRLTGAAGTVESGAAPFVVGPSPP